MMKRRSAGRPWRALAVGAVLLAMAAAPGPALAAKASAGERNLEVLRQMAAAGEGNDCKTILKLGVPLVDAKGGTGLTDEFSAYAYDLVVGCEADSGATEAAYRHALRGTALENSSDYLWRMRLAVEVQQKRLEAAVATVEAMMQGRGAALNGAPRSYVWRLDGDLKDAGNTQLRRRLLKVLASDSYAPVEAFGPDDGFRYQYATVLVDAGETEAARAIAATLETPSTLAAAVLDSRIRPLLSAEPDIRAATERSLAQHRDAIARNPDMLYPLVLAASDLRALGRPGEALQLLQSVAGRVGDAASFSDLGDKLNWWWNELAYSHVALGHYDEAVAAFRKGAAVAEGGSPNVSQVINLAIIQNRFGHGDDALKTLSVFAESKRSLSPYGEMAMREARGCAHIVAGHPAEAAADLAFIRAHQKDAAGGLGDLLLCMGDMDGAAAAIIGRLDDPDRRAAALLQLSDYDDPPVPLPQGPIDGRLPALKARADVKAAIAHAGGTRRFRVQPDGL